MTHHTWLLSIVDYIAKAVLNFIYGIYSIRNISRQQNNFNSK